MNKDLKIKKTIKKLEDRKLILLDIIKDLKKLYNKYTNNGIRKIELRRLKSFGVSIDKKIKKEEEMIQSLKNKV